MSDKEIHINDTGKLNNTRINYVADDSSDDNMGKGDYNLDDFNLLINDKKLNKDSSESDNKFNQNYMKTNLDTINNSINKKMSRSRNNSSSSKHSRSSKNKFKGKQHTLMDSESSIENFNFNQNKSNNINIQDIMKQKQETLLQINKYKSKGYIFMKEYNMSSSLEDMTADLDRIKIAYNNKKGIKFCRDGLMFCCNGLEMLSGFTNIGNLDGWGESVQDDIETYDDVFEELYQKYGGYADVLGPELKLVFMLISSAFLYHMMNSSQTLKDVGNAFGGNKGSKNPLSGLLSGGLGNLFGGGGDNSDGNSGLGNFMNFASNLSGGANNMNDNMNDNMNQEPIITETPNINKTPIVKKSDHIIKSPELAGLETLLDDLSNTSKSTARRTNKGGKKVLSLN